MIGGEIGRPVENSTGPGTPIPTPHRRPGRDRVGRSSCVEQLVDALEAGLRAGRDLRGLVVVPEDPAVEARDGDVDAGRAEVGDEDVAGIRAEGQLAGGRPPVLGPVSPSATSPRSISSLTRWATIARPRPVRSTSSEREPRPAEPDLVEDR